MREHRTTKKAPGRIVAVSVIVPVLNEEPFIGGCLGSAWSAGADEIIVADGGSSDATVAIARACGAVVVETCRGRAEQMNVGVTHACGEVLLFLHADCTLAHGAIDRLKSRLAGRSAVVGFFRQRIAGRHLLYRLIETGSNLRARWLARPYGDQAMFFSRDVFEALGGFPNVPLMEDLLMVRAARPFGPFLEMREFVTSSPRRWQRDGIVRRILRNWSVALAERRGLSHAELLARYEGGTTVGPQESSMEMPAGYGHTSTVRETR